MDGIYSYQLLLCFSRNRRVSWVPRDNPPPPLGRAAWRLQAYLPDVLAHILNHHLISSNGLHCEEAPIVNVALAEF